MLFPYIYVPHQMERMQEFIDFIFYEVWCKAPASGTFGLNLFDSNAELREVMEAFYYSDTQGADFFYGHVERIYGLFSMLTAAQINQFQLWYQGNNDLEKVCTDDPAAHLARYSDIAVNHKDLADQFGTFFKGLYSNLDIAALKNKIGEIDDHYKAFMSVNTTGKCPFCGIADMQGVYHSTREAYDHYLPKGLYPFNSINFHNLVPACHHCNSSYKTSKDPAYTPKDPVGAVHRRKVFYPYTAATYSIDVKVDLNHANIDKLKPADIQLEFGPPELSDQIDTWKDVYGIEERYKAKCRSGDAEDWLEQIRLLRDAHGIDPEASLFTVQQQTEKTPFANSNFLKKAFLEGCHRAGLLKAIAEVV